MGRAAILPHWLRGVKETGLGSQLTCAASTVLVLAVDLAPQQLLSNAGFTEDQQRLPARRLSLGLLTQLP